MQKILKKDAMIVGPGVKTGLNILLDNPGEMGADRVADAVAALAQYPVPLVIVDMGTATTISVVDDKKHYIGGMILPGVQISPPLFSVTMQNSVQKSSTGDRWAAVPAITCFLQAIMNPEISYL